jgi:tRNA-dihydrouridine synthase B
MTVKKLKIGNISINGPFVLGPMAGVTDLPFRVLCVEQGCSMAYTEMISAKAVIMHNSNTEQMMHVAENERPTSLQLFGSDPDEIAEAAEIIENRNFDIFDLNMGCPVPKVVNSGEGSALMKNPKLIEKIVSSLVKRVKKPVTVKIRAGFDAGHINAAEVSKIAEAAGASAIAVHARTREQFYSGEADWDIIKEVKSCVSVPVIGNGDIRTPMDAKRMMEETGCDAVMVARAARGNPWIFDAMNSFFLTGEIKGKPDIDAVVKVIRRHSQMLTAEKGEYTAMCEMRKHIAWYTQGYKNSAKLRASINNITTFGELDILLEKILASL